MIARGQTMQTMARGATYSAESFPMKVEPHLRREQRQIQRRISWGRIKEMGYLPPQGCGPTLLQSLNDTSSENPALGRRSCFLSEAAWGIKKSQYII